MRAGALAVDGAREELLADAALAQEEDGGGARFGDALGEPDRVLERGALPDDAVEAELLAHPRGFALLTRLLRGTLPRRLEEAVDRLVADRLEIEVPDPELVHLRRFGGGRAVEPEGKLEPGEPLLDAPDRFAPLGVTGCPVLRVAEIEECEHAGLGRGGREELRHVLRGHDGAPRVFDVLDQALPLGPGGHDDADVEIQGVTTPPCDPGWDSDPTP